MAWIDPNEEWLGHVQPVGLVVAPVVLRKFDLVPQQQTRGDTEAAKAHLTPTDKAGPALRDAWAFFHEILGWQPAQVAGAPGGPTVPENLVLRIDESDTAIAPHWAVAAPGGGHQILVRIEAAGVDPDGRGALAGWEATPHQRLERLCKEKEVRTGILVTDGELRLIYAPRGETSGWLRFPLRSLGEVGGRPMLGGLKLLLSSYRLHNDATDRRLPALLQASRDAQAEVSTKLAAQVLGALHELMRGLVEADGDRLQALARSRPDHLYDGLLTVLLRLVFLLYAEDRDLIPSSAEVEARAFYAQGYGVRSLHARLLEDRTRHELTMHLRRGAWARLLALFRLVHSGDASGDWIRGRGGRLFDPAAFPFLQGQDGPDDAPAPAEVSDECVLRILDRLLVLDGEKLSYRTLDVEQIGSVYETVMGFTVETMAGPALAIRAGKHNRTPVFVDLARLLAAKPAERVKFLKEDAERSATPAAVERALKAAATIEDLVAALHPIVDERASPGAALAPAGTPLLQPTDERRRTGSHYTPRALTEPIVRHALEPAFERIGADATAEDVLSLKVCDPAMGSGAFLVEACRALGDRLVAAWARWPKSRPPIPADEDEPLHARRLVAQRCLYGVDKNPRAVELAKLSLWLATLARDHEFTFLDHALKSGDSLVGLDREQIAAMHWDASKPGLPLFRQFVADRVEEARKARADIQAAPDDTLRIVLEQKHKFVEDRVALVRILGDAVLSAFFEEAKPKARETRRATIESWVAGNPVRWDDLRAAAASLRAGEHPLVPFHWPVEFPEVFLRENGGFDSIIGNPPFLGGKRISEENGEIYNIFLVNIHENASKNTDLVAHFFRRAHKLIRSGGSYGLVATNTICQGDTRTGGLQAILQADGEILRSTKRLKWPGEAAVVVSVVHLAKKPSQQTKQKMSIGASSGQSVVLKPPILDGRAVSRISSYLVEGYFDAAPQRLAANRRCAFIGSFLRGMGFTFDDEGRAGVATSLRVMRQIVEKEPRNASRIRPFIGGEEVANDPLFMHRRYVIDFGGLREEEARGGWPDLMAIVENNVRPEREKLGNTSADRDHKARWWQFANTRPALYQKLRTLDRVLVQNCGASPHLGIALQPANRVFAHTLCVFAFSGLSFFAALQARPHEVWARFFASTLEDRLRYTPSDCFETFPFPPGFETSPALEAAGQAYHDHRAALMVARNEGMTKTYNRFHDRDETAADIERLRELHAEMDRAVLAAYGWHDLAARAEPVFLDETTEDDHTYQGRLFWPSDFRDEVLARLLALNAERAEAERRAGLAPAAADEEEEVEA